MGLFDLFRKKTDTGSVGENQLEAVLKKAAAEPAFRPEFYKRLVSDNLVVLTARSELPDGTQTLKENSQVSLVTFQDGKIPVFTSTNRIFDKDIVKEQVPYLQLNGQDLFQMARGATFILNPYSDYGKELPPHEIESILDGSIFSGNHKKITIQQETQVQIGQPAKYPTEMVNSLKTLFATKRSVKKAYLGWIFDPASGEPPHYMIGLDATDIQNTIQEAGFTAQQFLSEGEMVNFMQIDDSGVSNYLVKQTRPFYEG